MSLDWNQIIKTAESELVKALASRVATGIITSIPWLGALSGPLNYIISILVSILVKYGDFLAYMVADDWKNTAEGKAFEDAALKNANTPADSPDKAANEKAQKDAFDKLMGAG